MESRMFWTLTQIALGGAIGALARFGVVTGSARLLGAGLPFGTVFANVTGSFIMGVVFVWLGEKGLMRHAPLLMVGTLGAYTTFSSFSLDALKLWEQGQFGLAVGYVGASVFFSIAALVVAVIFARGWFA
jgi:CrcB protein